MPDDPLLDDYRAAADLWLRAADMPYVVRAAFLDAASAERPGIRPWLDALIRDAPAPADGHTDQSSSEMTAALGPLLHQFLRASRTGGRADVGAYVPPPGAPGRERALAELIKIDLKDRWAERQPKSLEVYLHEWPELQASATLLLDLLRSECLARAVSATAATPSELESRFPALAPRVALDEIERQAQSIRRVPRADRLDGLGLPSRFTVIRKIGQGGMSVVYEALDQQRGTRVALKTLPSMEPLALYRFKREFRTVANLSHPNLVPLYELISDGSRWFFTMELVDGVDFIMHVRGTRRPPLTGASAVEAGATVSPLHTAATLGALRRALRQLVEGVATLHAFNILHRDLKPSNVLVRSDGQVVILDFGLAKEIYSGDLLMDTIEGSSGIDAAVVVPTWTGHGHIVGSIPYMSPEQASGSPLTEASDWYAIGVMLYEALAGQLPFNGRTDVLIRKQTEDPEPPGLSVRGVPDDLERLCMALLDRDSSHRPDGNQILAMLAHRPRVASPRADGRRAMPFVGRDDCLETLNRAFDELRDDRPVGVHIRGRSGAGKTAIAQRFLETLPETAIVLTGRCYEQESVPYKALDSIIDDLCRYFMGLPDGAVDGLIPADIGALSHIFPVLERVDAVRDACAERRDIPDVRELRRRAFAALGEIFRRLGDQAPLVLFIDDLQWGDVDSAGLIISLLEAPQPPRLLLAAGYRTESVNTNPCLLALNAARRRLLCFDIDVEPLPMHECVQLAGLLLDGARADDSALQRIARESGGNPYFVYELARQLEHGAAPGEGGTEAGIDLDDVLWRRAQGLPAQARQLLELISVAGKPLPLKIAAEAADLGPRASSAAAVLRAERLIRSTGPAFDDDVETYHDRIRESISSHLAEAVKIDHHRRLAYALEIAGNADIEAIASHFHRAGLLRQAAARYAAAGDRAGTALAFDRSAELYGLSLELGTPAAEEQTTLLKKQADALANAGRGREAAEAYQRAAGGTDTDQTGVIELQRNAGYQYCVSGHIDQGRAAFATVLAHLGMKLPATRRQALISLLRRRALLRLRGMRFRERSEAEVPRAVLDRIDIFWSVAAGMTIADPIRGADFQTHGLILALRAGEPYRIARALAWEAAHIAMVGIRLAPRAEAQLAAADALARRIQRPHLTAMMLMSKGVAAYFRGDFLECRRWSDQGAHLFRDQVRGASWELETCNAFAFWSFYFRGEYKGLTARYTPLIAEVRARGARLAEADLTTFGGPFVWLAADDPDGADRAVQGVMGEWSRQDFQVQHFTTLTAEAQIALYRGDGRAAWERVQAQWAGVADAMLLHVEIVRIYMLHLRARCALAAVGSGIPKDPLLRVAAADARQLERSRPPYAKALARTIRASLAWHRGDRQMAAATLERAADELEALGWGCFGVAARRRCGELTGGDTGRRIVQAVDDLLSAEGVKRPDLMSALQVPGFGPQ